ncbi:hypothetical protein JR316_0013318 [Psilocybe cubensis]|uniref:Uncharacterized protein n=2 Tax=Psilocybe cubensis TaxID=181762 RepID=A0A8H7XSD6_PSICU|nr:hypothetical protein JR316_0013318 [Psilocybe cubensis]KAH9474850.1 hypothetical protein JR316_0013318 [Psilocybe cubensis]
MASHVDTFSSTLILPRDSPTVRLPLLFYCKLDRLANKGIRVYSTNKTWLESVFPPSLQSSLCATIVDTRKESDIEFAVADGRVRIYQFNEMVSNHIGSLMRKDADCDDVTTIRAIVKASLHFYHNLCRKPPCQFEGVHMELYKLSATMTEEFDQVFKTDGENILTEEPVTMVVDEDVPMGVTIYNNSDRDLYPYLFYFDPSELTIGGSYLPAIGAGKNAQTTKVDAPLPARLALAIGHGDGGATPWSFLLPPGVKKDLGFFRLFLSTRPASFESILQEESPFSGILSRSMQSQVVQDDFLEDDGWSVQTVTMIQV